MMDRIISKSAEMWEFGSVESWREDSSVDFWRLILLVRKCASVIMRIVIFFTASSFTISKS